MVRPGLVLRQRSASARGGGGVCVLELLDRSDDNTTSHSSMHMNASNGSILCLLRCADTNTQNNVFRCASVVGGSPHQRHSSQKSFAISFNYALPLDIKFGTSSEVINQL